MSGTPVLQTVMRAASGSKRGLAEITTPRPQVAAAQTKSRSEVETSLKPVYQVMDGCEAAAYIAYAFSDISFIYPISPATSMGEYMDKWAASGKKNILGQVVDINMMQSEAGAAGALHGAAAAGTLTSTFTASQGLLLMIPNMYLLAGELVPTVFHVSARTVSKHALSIFNDHSDVMACRQTGFAMLASSSVQEVMDLGLVAHVSSLKSRIPFMHFFDGYRTSAEMSKIEVIPYEHIGKMFPHEKVKENLHRFALNPYHPMIRGTGQRPDIFFQSSVAAAKYYQKAPEIVEETLYDLGKLTGRNYNLFQYHGSQTAERVAVCIGSSAKTLEETVNYLNQTGENVGVISVRLFRPWSSKHFLSVLPKTVTKIAVLDRTREEGASGMPLFLDVNVAMSDAGKRPLITGATYGLASKEFTPAMIKAVFDNLNAEQPKLQYVIGVEDDVTHTSLDYSAPINTTPESVKQCLFWGLGSDGTVGANKTAIKTIGLNTDLKAQGHFVFDSHKADGVTVSHLRFGPEEIKSEYTIQSDADYLSCSHPSYVYKYEMLEPLKDGGIFVLNSPWTTLETLEKKLPARLKRDIASKKLEFYNIDATGIAQQVGLGKRVNMIMQAVFYGISDVLPKEEALKLLKESIKKQYSHKGPKVIDNNILAVDASLENLKRISYPASWIDVKEGGSKPGIKFEGKPEFVTSIMEPVLALEGDKLPVSSFEPGGYQPIGTSSFEKRGIAPNIPVWKPDACTQCNYCAIVCPHAVVRPFLLDKNESRAAPPGFEARKAKGGAEVAGFNYTIQISPYDCTGCEVCVESCPDDALYMAPFNQVAEEQSPHWDYAIGLPERCEIGDKYTVKGSQFQKPLLEFSGACAGCGETPYLKLATQLYGDRMVIANASGCSSVWGGTSTTIPFTTNKDGRGPAWGRSLFEDNAEYGFGMMLATKQRRSKLQQDISMMLLEMQQMPENLKTAFNNWVQYMDNPDRCEKASLEIEKILKGMGPDLDPRLQHVLDKRDMLRTQSHWLVGGDGWAYDIGYGGVDHVMARGEKVNILVLDTEMYSNTGGQVSKATQMATVIKYATHGKRQVKKDLGLCAMQYENVYVASVALGANMNQCVQAFKEAEHYPGTSLIIAYSPCIDWGIEMKHMMDEQKEAVESGYWTLYRYDPRRADKGLNPFQLDSKKIKSDLQVFLDGQNRFQQLTRSDKKTADKLHTGLRREMHQRHTKLQKLAMDDYEMLEHLKKQLGEATDSDNVMVLYGSETGTAATLAQVFANEFKRRGIRAKCLAMDELDFDELPKQTQVFCVVATCGQGEFPSNCRDFWKAISDPSLPSDLLKDTKFAVFGLGDSSYVYFNESAKKFYNRFKELGGATVSNLGMGDEKDEDHYETRWNEWLPELWNELGTPPPSMELLPPSYAVSVEESTSVAAPDVILPTGSKLVPMVKNVVLTPPDYDRDIRHYEFDLQGSGMTYSPGDCLGVYPHNNKKEVLEWCEQYGIDPNSVLKLEDLQGRKEVLPPVVKAGQLFTEVLDIFGKPARRFYETLQMAAKDDKEKKEIEYLLGKDGKPKLKELGKETPSYADLLRRYPSSKLSLDFLLDHVPRIKPRLYSIASSSEMHKDMLHLCIVKDDWKTASGQVRYGLCTRYLSDLSLGGSPDLVSGKINAAGITIPDTHSLPCVMVGLGTGIAPFRAMVQDREMARMRGETIGPMALFFGARHKRTDYTYGDEFDAYHASGKGIVNVLSTAFSRDQEHKIYVQDRINEHPDEIYEMLGKQKGYFYLCGPAGNVPPSVRKAVVNAFVKSGGHSEEEADKLVTQMQIEGRYNVEAW